MTDPSEERGIEHGSFVSAAPKITSYPVVEPIIDDRGRATASRERGFRTLRRLTVAALLSGTVAMAGLGYLSSQSHIGVTYSNPSPATTTATRSSSYSGEQDDGGFAAGSNTTSPSSSGTTHAVTGGSGTVSSQSSPAPATGNASSGSSAQAVTGGSGL